MRIQNEHRIQLQVNNELLKGMSLKSLIIARVAAKLGKNPIVLQHRLMTSYYAKLTGFIQADNDIATDQIIFPSQLIYDFDDLREKNNNIEIEDAKIISETSSQISDNNSVSLEDVKLELMKRLIEQRSINKKTVESIEMKRDGVNTDNG